MSDFERKTVEHLEELAREARRFYDCGCVHDSDEEECFEKALDDAERFLEEVVGDADL